MRIDSGYIGMESARSQASVTAASVNVAAQGSVLLKQGAFGNLLTGWADNAGLSGMEEDTMTGLRYARSNTYSVKEVNETNYAEKLHRIREECVMYLFELLFAHRKKGGTTEDGYVYGAQKSVTDTGSTYRRDMTYDDVSPAIEITLPKTAANVKYFHAETETTCFSTRGKVVTGDGREIEFGMDLQMSRSFKAYYEENYVPPQAQLCDPLVINLNAGIGNLSDQKFMFDLDQDGILDKVSQLESGSGFLALDKNSDGKINDGGELFGTKSGDGFRELAAYDDDGDGWIDEDDEIFDKLLIWAKDDSGKDTLYHLKEAGVGAICLSHVPTEFSLNSMQNHQTNGIVRSTGIFLFENGGAGTVQHIDIAK